MAAPSVRAVGAKQSGTGAITPVAPASHVAGDIEYLLVESDNGTTCSLSTAAGFAAMTSGQAVVGTGPSSTSVTVTVFWRRWNGTDGDPTVADTGNHTAAFIVTVQNAIASGTPHEAVTTSTEATADTSGSVTGGTTTDVDRLILGAVATALPDADADPSTQFSALTDSSLSSLTKQYEFSHSAGNGGALMAFSGVKATAGAWGPTTYTHAQSTAKAHVAWAVLPVPSGTTFTKSLGGGITPTGALVRQTAKRFTGGITPTGTLARQTQRSLGGGLTPTGALVLSKVALRSFGGSLTPTGALTRQAQRKFGGSLTPTGALARQVSKRFAGAITPTGALTRRPARTYGGTVTPTGVLVLSKVAMKSLGGSLTPTGVLYRTTQQRLGGTLAPSGDLRRTTGRLFVGTLTPSGTLFTESSGPPPVGAPETVHLSHTMWAAELEQTIPEVGSTFRVWPVEATVTLASGLVRLAPVGASMRLLQVIGVEGDTVVAIEPEELDPSGSKDQGDI